MLSFAVLAHSSPAYADTTGGECVILLHGLGRTSLSMKAVEWRPEDEGFQVVNNSYPSLGEGIEQIAPAAIQPGLQACDELGTRRVNFVTHSMGGIVLRTFTQTHPIEQLGRVVMLAPPNQGSAMADELAGREWVAEILPQTALQLGTGPESVPARLGPVSFELGVIAGDNSRRFFSYGLEGKPNDGTVAVEETRVEGMTDFIVMPADHSFLMWQESVLDQVVKFLRLGQFDHGLDE